MPNNIKNKIVFFCKKSKLLEVLNKYGTNVDRTPRKTHDNDFICKNADGEYGWYNKETDIFTRRDKDPVKGLPSDFEIGYNSAYFMFPDFNKIKEMPIDLKIESNGDLSPLSNTFMSNTIFKEHLDKLKDQNLSQERIDNFIQGVRNYLSYGYTTWYNWSVEHWGTKWNSYSHEKLTENIFTFETAWSGVPKLIEEMAKQFPEVKIKYIYAGEDTGCNVGCYVFHNGDFLKEEIKNESIRAYELAFELRPDYKDDYELIDGKYRYKYSEVE